MYPPPSQLPMLHHPPATHPPLSTVIHPSLEPGSLSPVPSMPVIFHQLGKLPRGAGREGEVEDREGGSRKGREGEVEEREGYDTFTI